MKSRALKIILVIILVFVFIIALSISALAIYIRKNIDREMDEALFMDAREEKSISFYYDADLNDGADKYTPVLFYEMKGDSDKKEWLSYEEFSPYLREGFLAMEDRRFFSHHGVDVKRTVAATLNLVFNRTKSFGGSTITQQVIKNISGDSEKTVKRKFDEIIRAYQIELSHSKEEIFELYLNILPMGNSISGAGYASKVYFGKEASELNAAEAATLIAIANAPTKYSPYRNKEACKEKRDRVLAVMYDQGIISHSEYRECISLDVRVREYEDLRKKEMSPFAEAALDDAIRDLMKDRSCSYEAAKLFLYGKGARIYTTMDFSVQSTLQKYFEGYENFPDECKAGLEYSMVICDSQENLLRAIVGNVGKRKSSYNQALTLHTPASTLKPLALYLPLVNERVITWSTVFDDAPVSFFKKSSGETVEYPKNSPQGYDGLTTVADALMVSKNTVAVRLYNLIGAKKIYKNLTENYNFDTLVLSEEGKSGVVSDLAPSPLALGQLSRGVTLRRLTEAYSVFPCEGTLKKGKSYFLLSDSEGTIILTSKSQEKQVSDREAARAVTQMLMRVVDSGTASKITIKNLYDTAGKTGTSGSGKDKLFVGFTPYYTAGIWCGYTDKSASVKNSEKSHLIVWDEVMKLVHEKTVPKSEEIKSFSTEGLVFSSFCKDSGALFSESCVYDPRGDRMDWGYFIRGTEPSEECDSHIVIYENMFPFLNKISLIQAPERIFPKEIPITDEKYVYRQRIKYNYA